MYEFSETNPCGRSSGAFKEIELPRAIRVTDECRVKRKLGDLFDLKNFGVNLTTLSPGSMSALHSQQDEFIYIVSGTPTLVCGNEYILKPGECVGFRAGEGDAHHFLNHSENVVTYLEIGDRTGDEVVYPDDDICAKSEADGTWTFTHKDGRPY